MQHLGPFVSPHGLDLLGIEQVQTAYWNLTTPPFTKKLSAAAKPALPKAARLSP